MKTERRILRILDRQGFVRTRDLTALRIPTVYLYRLLERGLVERSSRGVYVMPGATYNNEYYGMAEVCKRVPQATICLLSALQFHGLTTQSPTEIWIALPQGSWAPKLEYPPVHIVRFSGAALHEGVQELEPAENMHIRVYNVAKTVVDCFRWRNKLGLDVALEALRDGWRQRRFTMDELWHYAKVCRAANVMRPYLEAIA